MIDLEKIFGKLDPEPRHYYTLEREPGNPKVTFTRLDGTERIIDSTTENLTEVLEQEDVPGNVEHISAYAFNFGTLYFDPETTEIYVP